VDREPPSDPARDSSPILAFAPADVGADAGWRSWAVSTTETTGLDSSVVRGATVKAGARPSFGYRVFPLVAAGEGLADEDADQGREEQPAGKHYPEHRISAFPLAMVWTAPPVDGCCSVIDVCAAQRSGWRRG